MTIVRAEKMAAGGDAIGHLPDGRVVFVDGAIAGELVEADVHTLKKDFARASAVHVLEPVDRVQPPCPALAQGCGGCSWQHVDPAAQLRLKTSIVVDALARTAKLRDADVRTGSSVPPWAYRTTLRLAVGGGFRLGLRRRSSHDVVALDDCLVAHPLLAALLPEVRVRGASEVTIRVSAATGEITAVADVTDAVIEGLPANAQIGEDAVLSEDVGGTRLRVSAGSFFQSGPVAAALLVATVREVIGRVASGERLLDAYGGIGLFAAAVTSGPVVLVESAASACADAKVNLGDRAVVVNSSFERWRAQPVDVVVADPARTGLGAAATAVIAATGAPRLVLVSCDPVAMARDTSLLDAVGYEHCESIVLDLFPHTPHVEVVTRFERR